MISTNLSVSPSAPGTKSDVKISVTVTNTGKLAGKEVVQVYLTDGVSSVVTPNQQLAGFEKVQLS